MSFKKLNKTTEQAVMSAIEKIIDDSRHMPDADLNKVAADVFKGTDGMTPELIRRACEAYNKSKSVHTLQKRAAEDRAEEFPLIDSDQVINKVYGYHQKAASSTFELPAPTLQDNILKLHEGLKKVASESEETVDLDSRAIDRQIYRSTKDIEKKVERFHIKVANYREISEQAMNRVCQIVRRLPKKQIQKVARLTVNRYGEDGVRFMKVVGAFTDNEFPLQKTAAAAIFPLEEPYTSITIAIDEARNHSHYSRMLEKVAGVAWDENKAAVSDAWKDTLSVRGSVAGGAKGVAEAAKVTTGKLLDPLMALAAAPVKGQLAKSDKVSADKVYDAETINELDRLDTQETFMEVAMDDFTKDYPIADTIQAFNNVASVVPGMVKPKYAPWMKALVREQLVQGNAYDSATVKQIQDIGKELTKGRKADIDAAVAQMSATGGKELPGLQVG
jgi:hypothetical protein